MVQSTSKFADALRAAKAAKAAGKPEEAIAIQAAFAEEIKEEGRPKISLLTKYKDIIPVVIGFISVIILFFIGKLIKKLMKL